MLYILFGIESKDMLVQIYVAQLIQNHLLKFPPPPPPRSQTAWKSNLIRICLSSSIGSD